jgi:CheY-like chemotaxis protein
MTPVGTDLQASILIVDDDRGSLLAMEEVLRSLGARLVTASSGEEALRCVLEEDFAAILMDVRMPGIDGFTTARMIRERSRSRHTPIIFLTAAQEDLSATFRGYQAGAVDYIVKPVIPRCSGRSSRSSSGCTT